MQMSDVVESPITWILTGICIVGCIYAKRNVVSGVITGIMAPMVIVPLWIVSGLAVNVPHLMVRSMFPDLLPYLQDSPSPWAALLLFTTYPGNVATLITAALFIWYCIVGRESAHRRLAFTNHRSRLVGSNPFMKHYWR